MTALAAAVPILYPHEDTIPAWAYLVIWAIIAVTALTLGVPSPFARGRHRKHPRRQAGATS